MAFSDPSAILWRVKVVCIFFFLMILFLVNEEHENRTHCLLHFCLENCPSALLICIHPLNLSRDQLSLRQPKSLLPSDNTSPTHLIILEKKRPYPPPSVIFWIILHTKFAQFSLAINKTKIQFSSVQSLSHVRLFETLWIAHARPPCPSPTPRVYPNSCPSSWWCHPAVSSSVVPFSSCLQSFAASGSFPMSQLFAWGSQSTGVSASKSVVPMNTQDWSSLGWTGWISLQSRDSKESPPTPQFKSINSSALSLLHSPTLTSIHDQRKNHSLE